jgi:GDP-L-fucose synthase
MAAGSFFGMRAAMQLAGKSVVVTGGAGFLGSHLVDRLRVLGAKQVDAPRSSEVDLCDRGQVRAYLDRTRPEVIFHLAARVGGIGANQASPGKFFYENLQMGLNVIDEARLQGVRKVIVTGSICAYPKFTPVPFREEDLWNGYPEETNAPYGIAKKALLVMSAAYREQYGFNSVVLFPVNLYGPRDNFDLATSHVIPAMIRKFLDAKAQSQGEVELWGDGSPTREFLFVDDCAQGLILAAEGYESSEPVNLGAGFEIAIRDLAEKLRELCGYRGKLTWNTTRPNGQPRRQLDTSRAFERFGFQARTSFDQGLRKTIAWYIDWSGGAHG